MSGRTGIISDRVRTSRKPSDRPEPRGSQEGHDGSEEGTRAAEDGAGNEEGNREYTEGSAGEVKGKNERGAEDRKINGKC